MEDLKTLKEFLLPFCIDDQNVDDLVDMYKAARELEFRWQLYHCAFCGKRLTDEEVRNHQPDHYHLMCGEHLEYAQVYQLNILRNKLGLTIFEIPGFYD